MDLIAAQMTTHPAWCVGECDAHLGGEHRSSPLIVPGSGPLDFTFVDLLQMEGGEPMLRLRRAGHEVRYTERGGAALKRALTTLLRRAAGDES